MMKVDLEAKLDGLSDEIEFLKHLYDAVITSFLIFHFQPNKNVYTGGISKVVFFPSFLSFTGN